MKQKSHILASAAAILGLNAFVQGVSLASTPVLVSPIAGHNPARTADLAGLMMTVFLAFQLLGLPLQAAFAAVRGPRLVLVLAMIAQSADNAIVAFIHDARALLLAKAMSGLCAGSSLILTSAVAQDATSTDKRIKRLAILGASPALGVVTGPALGGLLSSVGPSVPFLVLAILSLLLVPAVLTVSFPEGVSPSADRRLDTKSRQFALWTRSVFLPLKSPSRRPFSIHLILTNLAQCSTGATLALEGISKFRLQPGQMGLSISLMAAGAIALRTLGLPLALRLVKTITLLRVLTAAGVAGYGLLSIAQSLPVLFCGMALVCLSFMSAPLAQGLVTDSLDTYSIVPFTAGLTALLGVSGMCGPFGFSYLQSLEFSQRLCLAPQFLLSCAMLASALAFVGQPMLPEGQPDGVVGSAIPLDALSASTSLKRSVS